MNKGLHAGNTKLKWLILWVAVALGTASIYYTHLLVNQLKTREAAHIQLYAKALEHTLNSDEKNILFAAEEVIYKDNSIPTILVNEQGDVVFFENLDVDPMLSEAEKNNVLKNELSAMKTMYPPIAILLRDPNTGHIFGKQFIYYKNSYLLSQLIAYPYIQFFVLAVFGFISYLAFSYSKADEQNQLWVSLAKETAHQIGTPLSSLMAWVEALREDQHLQNKDVADELDKDVQKLLIVTQRFSSMGSAPALKKENIAEIIHHAKGYLQPRISSQIGIAVHTPPEVLEPKIHAPLLEWVIEALCKNAVDAMETAGTITITVTKGTKKNIFVDIADTGKGIPKGLISKIFKPGFTTKKHGWGLGLALTKRIVEQYHKGKISVKSADKTRGTTFRIELRSD